MGEVFEAENQGSEISADIDGFPVPLHKTAADDARGVFRPKGFADNPFHGDACGDPDSSLPTDPQ